MSNKGIARGGGGYALPFTARILYPRLRCKALYINRNGFRPAKVVSRWSGCFMPKMKCLSASVLVMGRAFLFVEVKNLFSDQVILPSIV